MSAMARCSDDANPSMDPVAERQLLQPVFTGWKKAVNWTGILVWAACVVHLAEWWFDPAHIESYPRFIVVTIALSWVTLMPAYFIFIFAFAKIPSEDLEVPADWRIAAVVAKAPSEPLSVAQKTLLGALNQEGVRHDVWLADEKPDAETLAWCREHGIQVSTRHGVEEYQRPDWPRRARCKEGNLAYFYDHYGYSRYDIVAQFDVDHIPSPGYLKHAVTPFLDPGVGYVSAPSICDTNASTSWSARARLYSEASLHGALQAGYNAGWAPICIGSHYTVRTAALKQVGGLGPELAEDHSTTLIFNAGGWRGVHAINAIAHGAGPDIFSDLVVQEFQWSRSLMTILLKYSPAYVPKLRGRILFEFLFSQLWYPRFSLIMPIMYLMPIYALVTGAPMANVTYLDFMAHMLPVSTVVLILAYWWRWTGTFRPADAKILSWESMAFLFLRWPWSLFGTVLAIFDYLRGRVAGFRITPKGQEVISRVPFLVFAPYLFLALVPALTAWLVRDPGTAAGFYLFNIMNALLYGGLTVLLLVRHSLENGLGVLPRTRRTFRVIVLFLCITGSVSLAIYDNGLEGLEAWNEGLTEFTLTRRIYSYSGAGQSTSEKPILIFEPRWNPRNQEN